MEQNISFIYFDVGGVVIKDFSGTNRWNEMMEGWGISEDRKDEMNKRYDAFELEVTVGRDVEEFVPILKKEFGVKLPENYSLLQDFVDRFSKNSYLERVLRDIKGKYSLGLLTNMYPGLLAAIKKRGLLPRIAWDVVVDSSVVKHRKPDKEIYEIAQKEAGVAIEEILFVDNTLKNIEMAKEMGWKTYLYDPKNDKKSSEGLKLLLK
jgi:FMN phosphatase YigB (HAD superfamily)